MFEGLYTSGLFGLSYSPKSIYHALNPQYVYKDKTKLLTSQNVQFDQNQHKGIFDLEVLVEAYEAY